MLRHITYIICIIYFLKQKKCFTKKIDLFGFMNYSWYQDTELGFTALHDFCRNSAESTSDPFAP